MIYNTDHDLHMIYNTDHDLHMIYNTDHDPHMLYNTFILIQPSLSVITGRSNGDSPINNNYCKNGHVNMSKTSVHNPGTLDALVRFYWQGLFLIYF